MKVFILAYNLNRYTPSWQGWRLARHIVSAIRKQIEENSIVSLSFQFCFVFLLSTYLVDKMIRAPLAVLGFCGTFESANTS